MQQLREWEAIYEVEEWKAEQRMKSGENQYSPKEQSSLPLKNEEKGQTRDFVAKKVGLRSGHEVDRAIVTVNKIDELRKA